MPKNQQAMTPSLDIEGLRSRFGDQLRIDASLARLTTANVGGNADVLLVANSIDDLVAMGSYLWETEIPFIILGGGSNLLVSDAGVRGVVILNKARQVRFDLESEPPSVWGASGSNFGVMARQAAAHGLGDLEWAAGIPGTLGGAVVGNAGAHGSDISNHLLLADILHRESGNKQNGSKPRLMIIRENWSVERLDYTYRNSAIKQGSPLDGLDTQQATPSAQPSAIVLGAALRLTRSNPQATQARIDEFVAYRRQTQPPGASMGSMFKNPAGDFAGRLIEAAGLKGVRSGGAGISPLHANFFINYGKATAADIWELISLARKTVMERFGIALQLEIQLAGKWEKNSD